MGTLTQESPPAVAIWSTSVVVSKKELFKSYRNRPLKKEKDHLNMLGSWINLKHHDKEGSLLIYPYGNSKLLKSTTPS